MRRALPLLFACAACGGAVPPARPLPAPGELVSAAPLGTASEAAHGDLIAQVDREWGGVASVATTSLSAMTEARRALAGRCEVFTSDGDALAWHVECGSDATFASGQYGPLTVACGTRGQMSVFQCVGRVLAERVDADSLSAIDVDVVGSVDRVAVADPARLPAAARPQAFLTNACADLQDSFGVSSRARLAPPTDPQSEDDRKTKWNVLLSWCRAATAANAFATGFAAPASVHVTRRAIGAGTDWIEHHGGSCRSDDCADARRVDLFLTLTPSSTQTQRTCTSTASAGTTRRTLECHEEALGITQWQNPMHASAARSAAIPDDWMTAPAPPGGAQTARILGALAAD